MNTGEINGKTKLLGLMGYPVEHTLSPVIHNNLAAIYGHNAVYMPFKVKEEGLEEAVKGAFALNIRGLNATVPHKQAVIPYLSDIDPLAKGIGAVNTLVRTESGYKGYNTDILGLKRQLDNEGFTVSGRDVVIVGAGGAARAIAFLMANEGASRIIILNRTDFKAIDLAEDVNGFAGKEVASGHLLSEAGKVLDGMKNALCIQATSVGLSPNDKDCPIEDDGFFTHFDEVVDIIYKPAETEFIKRAVKAGAKAVNGLKMLLYQGVIAYELWTGVSVSEEDCDKVYKIMLKESADE